MNYEPDETLAAHVEVKGYRKIAWRLLGWEVRPDEDTFWSGYQSRTGSLVVVMVGDDRHVAVDPDEVTPIDRETFCTCCGQVGCGWG